MNEKIKNVYCKSAELLEAVQTERERVDTDGQLKDFISLKYMASVIHNELCREFYYLVSNPTRGQSKLMSLGIIILKLFEAHRWYKGIGNKNLIILAKKRGMEEILNKKLSEIKLIKPSRIEKYATYRNTLSGHYDNDFPEKLQSFGTLDSENFFSDIELMVRYSQEWLKILDSVGKLEAG